ncbi:ALF repeat-containing protein [Streptomyces sp. NRRL B-24484]|uniref:ALF repeat-containing protein n=1 Tax=Streptomyces sp. NRRL B-24484 TaxID=1463833 RepID=UPI0004BE745E|nr:ALF repeat-containing protein [Streptomyces sp. NRRL B-24484]
MKIRRSLATAVLLATAAAPVALGAAPAFADTAPAGQGQADQAGAKTDEENRAAIEKLLVYPNDYLLTAPSTYLREHAAEALAGTPEDRAHFLAVEVDRIRRDDARIAIMRIVTAGGPAVKKAGEAAFPSDDVEVLRAFLKVGQYTARTEDEHRAEVQRILDDPSSGPGVREAAQKALAGTAADVEHFLTVGRKAAAEDDDRVLLSQIMSVGGPAVRKAAGAALDGTIEDVRAFLKVGQYVARAEDENRARVRHVLDDADTGRHVREAAEKALAGTAADVEHFLKTELEPLRASDDRVRVSQIVEAGGPEVRKAGTAALNGTVEDVRAFLKEGQFAARAKDKAAAEAAQNNSTTTRAATTTGTTTASAALTTTTDGAGTSGSLASTGPSAPLGQLAAVGGAAVVLGAGAVIATRRRSRA